MVLYWPGGGELWSVCSHFYTFTAISLESVVQRVLQPHSNVLEFFQ